MRTTSTAMKIFNIAPGRTGTKSWAEAMREIGYRTVHLPRSLEDIARYDAACDLTVALWFRELDDRYPDAKFIFSDRDTEDWLDSWEQHDRRIHHRYGRLNDFIKGNRIAFFGQAEFDREVWRMAWERHKEAVRKHFKDRPDKLLWLCLCEGEGWDELCSFLQVAKPIAPFPHKGESPPAFVFSYYQDAELAIRLIRDIRKQYRHADVLAIADGEPSPEFAQIAASLGVRHLEGERLKTVGNGGAWLKRLFTEVLNYSSARRIVKFDVDSKLFRPFDGWPAGKVGGTLNRGSDSPPFVRGGCIYLERDAVQELLDSEELDSTRYNNGSAFRYRHRSGERLICCDRILHDALLRIGIEQVGWAEVCCNRSGSPPLNHENTFAVTHPVLEAAVPPPTPKPPDWAVSPLREW